MYKTFSNYPTWLTYAWILSHEPTFNEASQLCQYSLNKEVASFKLKQWVRDRLTDFVVFPDDGFRGYFSDLFKYIITEIQWVEISDRLRRVENDVLSAQN